MKAIEIDNKEYKVIERLPCHGEGKPALIVKDGEKERVVVQEGIKWRFWVTKDRLGRF